MLFVEFLTWPSYNYTCDAIQYLWLYKHLLAIIAYYAWFKRRILHAPNQILILVDSNEYVRLIWFKRCIVLPNKIAEHGRRVLNSHSSKHKYYLT